MAGPVKIKHHGNDITTDRIQGLQEFTDADIKIRTAEILTTEFAGTTGVGSLQVGTSGAPANFTSIGTFTNREHNSEVGDHPIVANDFSSTVYTFSQGTASATDNKEAVPVRLDSSDRLEEATDSEIDTEVIDLCIKAMVDQTDNACGQYYISASAPAGGTWTSRGQIDDTQTDGTTVTKYLWQKTAVTTVPGDNQYRTLVKRLDDNSFGEMTEANIRSLEGRFRNRIAANNIGKYVVDTAAPGSGTWQQMGETLTDQLKDSASYNYEGSYVGSYSGNYTGSYSGTYSGNYTGTYTLFYSGSVGGYFQGTYTGNYTGSYSGTYTGSYSGTYVGYYAGLTLITTSSTQESKKLFVRTA